MNRSLALLGIALAAPGPTLAAPSADVATGFVTPDGQLLLRDTDTHVTVRLGVAVVDVQQTFLNPFRRVVDATYLFPLPIDASARSLRVTCGEREIEATLTDREDDRQQYQQSREPGQQRPTLFTQEISSLCPGETVRVALQYVVRVSRLDGHDTLVFPPATDKRSEQADLKPEPIRPEQTRHRPTWTVKLLDGPITSVFSDTHAISVVDEGAWGAEVTFGSPTEVADSDVHVAWTSASSTTHASVAPLVPPVGTTNAPDNANLSDGTGGLTRADGLQSGERALGCGAAVGSGETAEDLGRSEHAIGSVGGEPILLCAFDRSTIDEVIQRQMNALRYCYQRELSRSPTLGGKVVVKFTIADDGTVSHAEITSTTMNNETVEACLIDRFLRMQFIVPADGGIIIVSYPFIFKVGE